MSTRALGAVTRAWPWARSEHGTLPVVLVALTVVTGVVDAVSYLALGHVFVANMTGNVVFLGFALAGAPGRVPAPASLAALGAFLLGSLAGGRIAVRARDHRGRHLRTAMTTAAATMLLAVALAAIFGQPVPDDARYAVIVPLAIAMGIQNATARRLAVPDLTTTVLTLTLTGIAADSRLAGGLCAHPARRLIAVTAMFAGALLGALLVIHVDLVLPLSIAAALSAASALAARHAVPRPPGIARPPTTRGALRVPRRADRPAPARILLRRRARRANGDVTVAVVGIRSATRNHGPLFVRLGLSPESEPSSGAPVTGFYLTTSAPFMNGWMVQ